jgi:hypothetical protein
MEQLDTAKLSANASIVPQTGAERRQNGEKLTEKPVSGKCAAKRRAGNGQMSRKFAKKSLRCLGRLTTIW